MSGRTRTTSGSLHGWRRPAGALLTAAAAAAVLAACGSSGSKSPAAASSASTPSATAVSGAPAVGGGAIGTPVTVDEVDFAIKLSTTTFRPGTYTFEVKNTGHATHALVIKGPGVGSQDTGVLGPDGTARLTVTLQKGTYELYCPVDGHRARGMDMTITVA